MKKSIKVSVICSVYNREKYIHKCVDSILNSSLKDIELILIDNGCEDDCPRIIDEYAKQDSRVIAVHNPKGSTYGKALNQGINLAHGKYIGIVESDDFIHPDMYKKLYNKAEQSEADVVFSGFYVHNSNGDNANHIHNTQIFTNSDDNKLFTITDYPFLLTCHQSIWSKLYRADFLKKIKFDEKGRYIDSAFMVDVCCSTKKIIALKEPLYYYCDDNPDASQSNARSDKSLMKIMDDWEFAKKRLKHYGMYDVLKEAFYYQASKASIRFYKNIANKYKHEFFKKYCKFLSELKKDKDFKYVYFENWRKKFFQNVLRNNYRATLYDDYKGFHLFKIPLFEKYTDGNRMVKKLFGIKIYEKIIKPDCIKRKYLYGILRSLNQTNSYVFRFLGIPLYRKTQNDNCIRISFFDLFIFCKKKSLSYQDVINIMQNRIDLLTQQINKCMSKLNDIPDYIQAIHVNRNAFEKYRGIYAGKRVVLCATGPTLEYYKPIDGAIHVGVNRAFKYDNVDFDYLFAQDEFPEGMSKINNYRNGKCKKFYGVISQNRASVVEKEVSRIAPVNINRANATPYILADTPNMYWPYDLAFEPIGDFQGTVFSALQFILYTQPSEIYLVGCDCSFGQKHSKKQESYNYQMNSWKIFADVVGKLYPNISVFSVNPIGLRGMFFDVYTRDFLQKHPEIDTDDIEVLE